MISKMRRWLKLDALNRAWRVTLQGIVATLGAIAIGAGTQVYQSALNDAAGGITVDWTATRDRALFVMGMAVLAYLHRRYLDRSPIPSAQPPAPPVVAEPMAQAGAMKPGEPGR